MIKSSPFFASNTFAVLSRLALASCDPSLFQATANTQSLWLVIVSCSLPSDTEKLLVGFTTSGAEKLQKKVPKARVVQAFNTVPSEVFFAVYAKRRRKTRPTVVYCGDDKKAKTVAAEMIEDVGFDPIDIGGLEMARYSEPFTFIIAQQAYETKRGPALAYRLEWYEERES